MSAWKKLIAAASAEGEESELLEKCSALPCIPGTYSWTVPEGVNVGISVVCIAKAAGVWAKAQRYMLQPLAFG